MVSHRGVVLAGFAMVEDGVSLDVGFYYMANALGRFAGTVLSGWVFQAAGLVACLWVSAVFVVVAAAISLALPGTALVARNDAVDGGD